MRTLIARLLVLGLAWSLTPGLTEAAENLWHLASAGHGAHAVGAGVDHAPRGDEHGCSGTFHLCACHHSVTPTMAPAVELQAPRSAGRAATSPPAPPTDPVRAPLFHPPRS